MRLTGKKKGSTKPCLTLRSLLKKQALHHNPASLMKFGEIIAPIDKSPDKTLFLRKEAKLLRAISQLRKISLVKITRKYSCWAGHKALL